MQQTRPRLESSHVNTEYVRKEEEEEEEEKEEERRKEEGAGGVQEKQEPHTKDVGNKNGERGQPCEIPEDWICMSDSDQLSAT